MRSRKTTFISLLLLILILSACSVFNDGKVSQDLLPWKESGETLYFDDFKDDTSGWEIVNNAYELKGVFQERLPGFSHAARFQSHLNHEFEFF